MHVPRHIAPSQASGSPGKPSRLFDIHRPMHPYIDRYKCLHNQRAHRGTSHSKPDFKHESIHPQVPGKLALVSSFCVIPIPRIRVTVQCPPHPFHRFLWQPARGPTGWRVQGVVLRLHTGEEHLGQSCEGTKTKFGRSC